MKIRKSFVSNSSTSCFICDICGGVEAGMDACASELGMIQFYPCDHVMHHHCIPQQYKNNDNDVDMNEADNKYCPLCNLEILSDKDLIKYMIHIDPQIHQTTLETIKSTYKDYKSFRDAMKVK